MKSAVAARELITATVGGTCVRGTYHWAQNASEGSPRSLNDGDRIGILYLNPGVLPRAATGDSAVFWADSFARCGYPFFRFDLPGLGDSEGDLPKEAIDYVSLIDVGTYGPLVRDLADHVVKRFNLSGIVILGHCSGATSALFAAARNKNIQGLILLDPYFYSKQRIRSRNILSRWHMRLIRQAEERSVDSPVADQPRAGLHILSVVSGIFEGLKYIRRRVRRGSLPDNANRPLIACWKQIVAAGIPTLILRAPALISKAGDFDYFSYLRIQDRNGPLAVKFIQDTTHSFAEGSGKDAVRVYCEHWLQDVFPVPPYISRKHSASRGQPVVTSESAKMASSIGNR